LGIPTSIPGGAESKAGKTHSTGGEGNSEAGALIIIYSGDNLQLNVYEPYGSKRHQDLEYIRLPSEN
jgi:hypothetical protein